MSDHINIRTDLERLPCTDPPELCPAGCPHIICRGIPENDGTPVFCERMEKVRYTK